MSGGGNKRCRDGAISHNCRKVLGLILPGGPVTSLGIGQLPIGTIIGQLPLGAMMGGAALAGVGQRKPMLDNMNQSLGPHLEPLHRHLAPLHRLSKKKKKRLSSKKKQRKFALHQRKTKGTTGSNDTLLQDRLLATSM